MTDHETFEAWWLEQTRQGDPARRLNLQRDAFIAGMQAARATAEQRSLGDVTGAMYRCRRCGESSEIQFNFATLPKENSCCRQKPCARPGAGPCDMPAHATEEQFDMQTVSDDFSEYRRGLREAFNSINMINANRQGRTAEETCAYMVRSLADLVNGGRTRDIRALKSQQDAAIESKPTYEDGYRDAWSEACPNCGHVKGEQLDSGEAK